MEKKGKKQKKPTQTQEEQQKDKDLFLCYESVHQPIKQVFEEFMPKEMDSNTTVFITEKIHGTNFSIILDVERNGFLLGKRNSLVTMFMSFDEDIKLLKNYFTASFFQNHIIYSIEEIHDKIKNLFQELKTKYQDAKVFHLYGELFGGYYVEEDLKKFKPIQTEVKYSHKPKIFLFDIFIDKKPLEFQEFIKLMKYIDFPHVPVLEEKSLEELIDLKNQKVHLEYKEYQSKVPEILGEQKLDNNFAEGIVLCFGIHKLKLKSDKFFEIADAPKPKVQKKQKKEDPYFQRITIARIQNVMTKEGNEISFEEMYPKLKEDILKDMKIEKLDINIDFKQNEKKYLARAKGMYGGYMKKLNKHQSLNYLIKLRIQKILIKFCFNMNLQIINYEYFNKKQQNKKKNTIQFEFIEHLLIIKTSRQFIININIKIS